MNRLKIGSIEPVPNFMVEPSISSHFYLIFDLLRELDQTVVRFMIELIGLIRFYK
jgi:hypothetical protein